MAHKEGYEAPKVEGMDASSAPLLEDAALYVGHTEQDGWDGSCHQCCGECDAVGCSTFSLTTLFPCLSFGFNSRPLGLSVVARAALFFAVFYLSQYALTAAYQAALFTSCPELMAPPEQIYEGQEEPVIVIRPACQASLPWISTFAFISALVLSALVATFGARQRSQLRAKYGIPGSFHRDFWLWLCCSPCALCQETRTVMKREAACRTCTAAGRAAAKAAAEV